MGRILKIKNQYFVEFTGNGLRFQKMAGQTEAEARRTLRDIETSLAETALPEDLTRVTIADFAQKYHTFAQTVHTEKTCRRFEEVFTIFYAFLEERLSKQRLMKELTPRLMEDFKTDLQKHHRPQKVNFILFLVRDILEYARTLRYLNDNPTQHITFLKEGFDCALARLDDDIQIGGKEQDVLDFILATGASLDECRKLCWNDIDPQQACVRFYSRDPDRVPLRTVPLESAFLQAFKERQGRPDERIFQDIQWEKIPFQSARHTFGYRLLKKGVPLRQLNRFLGFDDIADVYPYGRFLLEH